MGILGLPCILHPIEFGHNMISSKDLWKLISMPDHLLFHGPLELSIWPNSFGCNMHGRPNILIIYVKVKIRVMKAEARSFHEDWWWDIFSFTYIMGILGLPCILHPNEFGHNMLSSMPDHLISKNGRKTHPDNNNTIWVFVWLRIMVIYVVPVKLGACLWGHQNLQDDCAADFLDVMGGDFFFNQIFNAFLNIIIRNDIISNYISIKL